MPSMKDKKINVSVKISKAVNKWQFPKLVSYNLTSDCLRSPTGDLGLQRLISNIFLFTVSSTAEDRSKTFRQLNS